LITLLKQQDPTAYLDLLREFETVKRRIDTGTTGKVNFTIPCATINSLCEYHHGESLSFMIQASPLASRSTTISTTGMTKLFEVSI
jgi:hypothetical protein